MNALRLVWIYPDLLSTYGDRGNVLVLERRARLRGLPVEIIEVNSDQRVPRDGHIYLMGGGAHYRELTDAFVEEFRDFIPVEVAPEPEKLMSIGYLYNSLRISDNKPQRSVGLDLGNSSSIISTFDDQHAPAASPNPVTL